MQLKDEQRRKREEQRDAMRQEKEYIARLKSEMEQERMTQ